MFDSIILPPDYFVIIVQVAFLMASAGVIGLKKSASNVHHDEERSTTHVEEPSLEAIASPKYEDSVTLVQPHIVAPFPKAKRVSAYKAADIADVFPHLCNPIVMTARTPGILDQMPDTLPRRSSTFTLKKRLPLPDFTAPQVPFEAAQPVDIYKAPGLSVTTSKTSSISIRPKSLNTQRSTTSVSLTSRKVAKSDVQQTLDEIFTYAVDSTGSQPKVAHAPRPSSSTGRGSAQHRDAKAVPLVRPKIAKEDFVYPEAGKYSAATSCEPYQSRTAPTFQKISGRREENPIYSRSKPAIAKSSTNILQRLRVSRKKEADSDAARDAHPAERTESQRRHGRFSNLMSKLDNLGRTSTKTQEHIAKPKSSVPQNWTYDHASTSVDHPQQQEPIAAALKRASDRFARAMHKFEKASKSSQKGSIAPADYKASAPPKTKKPKQGHSTPLSTFLLPPARIHVHRERPAAAAAPRARLVPMKSQPPVFSPPHKVSDVFSMGPKVRRKEFNLRADNCLYGIGTPDTRRIQKIDEDVYFVTSTPRVNFAHYGGFSTSTPRKGIDARRDSFKDFF